MRQYSSKQKFLAAALTLLITGQLSACSKRDPGAPQVESGKGQDKNEPLTPAVKIVAQRRTLDQARRDLQQRYTLNPDKRCRKALSLISQFFTRQPVETDMTFDGKHWQVKVRNKIIGHISEFPNFQEQLDILEGYAKELDGARPLQLSKELPHEKLQGALNMQPANLVGASADADKSWNQNLSEDGMLADRALIPSALQRGADTLVLLNFQSMDLMERADDLAARAWAMTTVSKVVCKSAQTRNMCLLAISSGYWNDARVLAKQLPANDPLRLCLEGKTSELSNLAKVEGASQETKILFAKLLSRENDRSGWMNFVQSLHNEKSLTLPILSTFKNMTSEESLIPYGTLLIATTINEVQNKGKQEHGIDLKNLVWTHDKLSESLDWMLHDLLKQLESDLNGLPAAEHSLFIDKATIAQYYRGYFYSAVLILVDGYLRMPSSQAVCSKFADCLHFPSDPAAMQLEQWIRCRARLRERMNENESLDKSLLAFIELGVPAMATVYIDSGNYLQVKEVAQHLQVGEHLFRFADTRPTQRMTLAHIAEQSLLYFKESKKLSNAAKLAGCMDSLDYRALRFKMKGLTSISIIEQYFRQLGLIKLFKETYGASAESRPGVVQDAHLNVSEKLNVLGFFANKSNFQTVDKEYKYLLQKYPQSWAVVAQYCHLLNMEHRSKEAETIVSRWIAVNKPTQLEELKARALLAECMIKDGRSDAALKILNNASDQDEQDCLRQKILALEALQRHDEAELWAKELVKMYKIDVDSVLLSTEIFWANKKFDLAAAALQSSALTDSIWYSRVGPLFLKLAKKNGSSASLALAALKASKLNDLQTLGRVARFCSDAGDSKLAFQVLSTVEPKPDQQSNRLVSAYNYRKQYDGEKNALAWLKSEVPEGYRLELVPDAYILNQSELLWDFVSKEDWQNDKLWFYRALAWVFNPSDRSRYLRLKDHFGSGGGIDGRVARYLLDLKGADELFNLSLTNEQISKVAYYVGWKELCRGQDFLDESEWFFLSVVEHSDQVIDEKEWSWNALKSAEDSLLDYRITLEFVDVKNLRIVHHRKPAAEFLKSASE